MPVEVSGPSQDQATCRTRATPHTTRDGSDKGRTQESARRGKDAQRALGHLTSGTQRSSCRLRKTDDNFTKLE